MELERGIEFSYSEPKNPIPSTISMDYKERFAKFGISVSYEPMANIRPFLLSSFFLYSYKYMVGSSSITTPDFNIPFLFINLTIRLLYRPSAAP